MSETATSELADRSAVLVIARDTDYRGVLVQALDRAGYAVLFAADRDDAIARDATRTLSALAPHCTGLIVDALLDQTRPEQMRRRLPAILASGAPDLAAWGLLRGLADASFDVRYYCSTVLTTLLPHTKSTHIPPDAVFAYVRKELTIDRETWKARKLVADAVIEIEAADADFGLAHVFRVLGLVLPAEPLRVALQAVQNDDEGLRAMALEYLESILPPEVRAQLWPLIDASAPEVPTATVADEAHAQKLLERMVAAATGEHKPVRKTS